MSPMARQTKRKSVMSLAIRPESEAQFDAICARERLYAILGTANGCPSASR
jgi:phosphoribosylformylglycinamidine synthase